MKFLKIITKIDDILFIAATAFLAAGCGLAVINAFFRKVFNMGLPWAEELSLYMVVMMLFLAMPYLEQIDRHLCIGILMSKLKTEKSKNFFRIVRSVWTIAVMGILFRFGITLAKAMVASHVATNILRWPRLPFFSALLIGFIMIIAVYICIIIVKKGGQIGGNNG